MSKAQNLAVPRKPIEAFIASMNSGVSPEAQALAARNLISALKKAVALVQEGIKRRELTVCELLLGYASPQDVDRFLRDEIPRLTVYRAKKPARNMGIHAQRPPKVYKERQSCTTAKKSTVNTTTGTHKRAAKPKGSSTR